MKQSNRRTNKSGSDKKRKCKPKKSVTNGKTGRRVNRMSITPNGAMIKKIMAINGTSGHYKDFVVLANQRLVDWSGSWDLHDQNGDPIGVEGVVLIHKSQLEQYVGEDLASKFWKRGIGRISNASGKLDGNQAET